MYSKKRNQPDGYLPPSSVSPSPKRLLHMHHSEAESMSSLDSEHSCVMQWNCAAPAHADKADNTTVDRQYVTVAVGKRSCTTRQRIIDAEECSKRSRIEYSEATVSGVTFQKDLNLHHARMPNAEYDSASVRRHVGSCHDSVCLNSRRSKLVEICGSETDVGKHGIRHNDADKHVTFISSRVQESRGSMLSVARQDIRESSASSISSCGQSRDGSHINSRNTSFFSRVRDLTKTSSTHGQKAEAGAWNRLVSAKHVVRSPQVSSVESLHAPFLNEDTMHLKGSPADTMHSKVSPPSYVLSSGRLSLEEETRLGRRVRTIDDDFEEYFSSLML